MKHTQPDDDLQKYMCKTLQENFDTEQQAGWNTQHDHSEDIHPTDAFTYNSPQDCAVEFVYSQAYTQTLEGLGGPSEEEKLLSKDLNQSSLS